MSAASELRGLAADLSRATGAIRRRAADETLQSAKDIGTAYRSRARRDTGAMAQSVQIKTSRGGLRAAVGPTSHYAVFQEEGTSSITGDNLLRDASDAEAADWQGNLARIPEELL